MNQLGKAWYGLGSDQAVYVSSTFRSWYATLPAVNQSRTKINYLGRMEEEERETRWWG